MKEDFKFSISKKFPFGELVLTLDPKEISVLRLLISDNDDVLKYWIQLWDKIDNYEQLLFSCKELMPFVVHKIQMHYNKSDWVKYVPCESNFLAGLPRFTWTKNQYIVNQYKIIGRKLEQENIEFIALKGVCEMIDGNALSLLRTSRDIDILIHEDDFDKCKIIFFTLGWIFTENTNNLLTIRSPIKPHAETLYNQKRIFDLDIHFSVVAGPKSISKDFTKNIWERKIKSKLYPELYVPSIEDRILINTENINNLHNWIEGHTTKYIFDLLTLSKIANRKHIENAFFIAKREIKNENLFFQLTSIIESFENKNDIITYSEKRFVLNKTISSYSLLNIIRLQYFFQLINFMTNGRHIVYVLFYLFCRILDKLISKTKNLFHSNEFKISNLNYFNAKTNKQFSIHFFAK